MIRFTWLQARTQTAVATAGLVIVAIALALTGPHLVHLYNTTVATCGARGDCPTATNAFLRNDNALRTWLGILVIIVPGVLGIFWGAPLVAREIESGTYRLARTQSVSRARWLAVKLGGIGLASMAVAGLLSLVVTWWASPLDKAAMKRFLPGAFDQRGIVATGYAAFAFVLAVAAGILIRRTLTAMATALLGFAAVRLAVTHWIRPVLIGAAHTTLPVTSGTGLGFTPDSSGLMTFSAGPPTIPNAWVVSSRLVDNAGHAPAPTSLHQFLQTACPSIANPSPPPAGVSRGPANQTAFQDCVTQISSKFRLAVRYQPASRYWAFQWYELAIFLGAGLILAGFCFWWLRRRHV